MADNILDKPSIADLRAALANPAPAQEPVTETAKPAEVATEPVAAATETTEPTQTTETTETKAVEPPPPAKDDKRKVRYSELTRAADEARAEAARLKAELDALRSHKPADEPAKPVVVAEDTEPVPPNSETWSGTWAELEAARVKWAADLADYRVKKVLREREVQAEQAEQAKAAQTVAARWVAQVDAAVEAHAEVDMKEALDGVGKVASKIMGLIDVIRESEVGAEIVVALHQDAEKLAHIAKLSPFSAAREIGRIEDRILAKRPATTASKSAAALPPPPQAVGGHASGSGSTAPLEKAGLADFKARVRRELFGK